MTKYQKYNVDYNFKIKLYFNNFLIIIILYDNYGNIMYYNIIILCESSEDS